MNSMKKQTHLAFLGHHALKKLPALTAFGGPLSKLASWAMLLAVYSSNWIDIMASLTSKSTLQQGWGRGWSLAKKHYEIVKSICTRELKYATFAHREPGLMAYLIIVLLLPSSKLGELHSFSAGGVTSQTNKQTSMCSWQPVNDKLEWDGHPQNCNKNSWQKQLKRLTQQAAFEHNVVQAEVTTKGLLVCGGCTAPFSKSVMYFRELVSCDPFSWGRNWMKAYMFIYIKTLHFQASVSHNIEVYVGRKCFLHSPVVRFAWCSTFLCPPHWQISYEWEFETVFFLVLTIALLTIGALSALVIRMGEQSHTNHQNWMQLPSHYLL